MAQANPYPLRVDKNIFEKFKVIAKENGRSINKEIEMMMKNIIVKYEETHGDIIITSDE